MGARSLIENGELRKDLPRQFGRLTYIRIAGFGKGREPLIECLCACGLVVVRCWQHLRKGLTTSCGCFRSETAAAQMTKHGDATSPTYICWRAMLERCTNANHPDYHLYGGRGILVCERWRESFAHFRDDMGERPSSRHSIDREEANGNYEPGNCRWATPTEQGRNKRNTIMLKFNGETLPLVEWAERYGIGHHTIRARLKAGVPIGAAITTPPYGKIPVPAQMESSAAEIPAAVADLF
jgi:hypothetical protein